MQNKEIAQKCIWPDDKLITVAIESISALIVSKVSEQRNLPLEQVINRFLQSKTYSLLSDKDTGYYWDSIPELLKMFTAELDAFTE